MAAKRGQRIPRRIVGDDVRVNIDAFHFIAAVLMRRRSVLHVSG
jgi:hypothetical protein